MVTGGAWSEGKLEKIADLLQQGLKYDGLPNQGSADSSTMKPSNRLWIVSESLPLVDLVKKLSPSGLNHSFLARRVGSLSGRCASCHFVPFS